MPKAQGKTLIEDLPLSAAELLQNRDDILALYGPERWAKIRKPWRDILLAVAKHDNEAILPSAIKIAKDAVSEGLMFECRYVLAVAVEEIEAEKAQ